MREDLTQSIVLYKDTVFQVALGYVKNIHDAEDIVQNVFLKLGLCGKSFASGEAEKAWLIRVTVNESKDLIKSAWRKNRGDFDDNESLSRSYTADDNESELYEFVKSLKPKYRTVIYLHYYEGYSTKEISAILKMSQTAVTTQLNRARKQLKEDITNNEEENSYGKLQGFI